jgi:hypothetical protein
MTKKELIAALGKVEARSAQANAILADEMLTQINKMRGQAGFAREVEQARKVIAGPRAVIGDVFPALPAGTEARFMSQIVQKVGSRVSLLPPGGQTVVRGCKALDEAQLLGLSRVWGQEVMQIELASGDLIIMRATGVRGGGWAEIPRLRSSITKITHTHPGEANYTLSGADFRFYREMKERYPGSVFDFSVVSSQTNTIRDANYIRAREVTYNARTMDRLGNPQLDQRTRERIMDQYLEATRQKY